jgi:hypothetical protein
VEGIVVGIVAKSVLTRHRGSFEAGSMAARDCLRHFAGEPPKLLLAYLTVNHDQPDFLRGLTSVLGPRVPVIGCSGQGVMGRGVVYEEGYAASVTALGGGSLAVATAHVQDIQTDTRAKGLALGKALRHGLKSPPRVTLLHYDPLAGADLDVLLGAVHHELECPLLGGAAAHYFDAAAMTTTFQYSGGHVYSKCAVGVALSGDFGCEMAFATGCAPVGVELTVTRAIGNVILELDSRPALEVWTDLTGADASDPAAIAALAIGMPSHHASQDHLIRAAFVLDPVKRGIVVATTVAEGTVLTLYHRTVEDVLDGAVKLGAELRSRLGDRQPKVVLGFECGARTRPFLGSEATNEENQALQALVAPDAEWGGVTCWGELFPVGGRPGFHDYTYPLLALAD